MSGPLGSSQWMYSSGGFYPTEIDQSLRFDGSSYLSRTPSVAGSLTTWTWSGWVKRGALGSDQTLFGLDYPPNDQNFHWVNFSSADKIDFGLYPTSVTARLTTTQVFRDPSAWYNIVAIWDTTNATADDRLKLYVNGVQITAFSARTNPTQNTSGFINTARLHTIGDLNYNAGHLQFFNGYMADTYFIDGQALDPTSFGEFKNGVWIPKAYTGSYGTNGFHLTYQDDTVSEGFNTVTYTGNGATQSISGVGFSPDLVWIKGRSSTNQDHLLADSVRGISRRLLSNTTAAEVFQSGFQITAFNSDGFTVVDDTNGGYNVNGSVGGTFSGAAAYVGWCWDAGSSTVSNTDGSITSSVRANPAYGFSIVSYTGNGTAGATIGHGLGAAPDMYIVKDRTNVSGWTVYNSVDGATKHLSLNASDAVATATSIWNDTEPTSSLFSLGYHGAVNASGDAFLAYCFHSVAGYSKIGSYTGTGATGNVVTTGFKPAFVMIKRTDAAGEWVMLDNTRSAVNPARKYIYASASSAEADAFNIVDFTNTGFTHYDGWTQTNLNGATYIYMAFADTRDLAFWRDQSGNGNDWQPNNLNYQDTVFDSPTNNYATLNPLNKGSLVTLSNGNLTVSGNSATNSAVVLGTIGMTSGKWYWETTITTVAGISYAGMGINPAIDNAEIYFINAGTTGGCGWRHPGGSGGIGGFGNTSATYPAFTSGDVISVAADFDNGALYFSKNNSWINSGVPTSGASKTGATNVWTAGSITGFPAGGGYNGNNNTLNFGQSGFTYTPPDGFLALCTANLPEPNISPLYGASPQDHFNTVLYTGIGGALSVTDVGFQPDLVWSKARNTGTPWHQLTDSVRGTTKQLFSNRADAEDTNTDKLTSFDSDGFTLGSNGGINGSGNTYVAWNWKASNATAVSNTEGTITSQVSANTTAGFSIVSWTGTGATSTVGHGLGATPSVVIAKRRNSTSNWAVQHASAGSGYFLLNSTDPYNGADTSIWNATLPTSSLFTTASGFFVNTATYIAYCFHNVEGYSKFGSYTGNGSATEGPFVYTGFRPAYIMAKVAVNQQNATSWQIWDAAREPYNPEILYLFANASDAESNTAPVYHAIDLVSNGFKLRAANTYGMNQSGATYIYMAFAENPFKYANAR